MKMLLPRPVALSVLFLFSASSVNGADVYDRFETGQRIDAQFRQFEAAKRAKNWNQARLHLVEIVKLDARNLRGWCELAFVQNELRNYDAAISAGVLALGVDNKCSNAWLEIGFAHMKLANFAKADDAFAEAIKTNQNNWLAYDYAADLLRQMGNSSGAAYMLQVKDVRQRISGPN